MNREDEKSVAPTQCQDTLRPEREDPQGYGLIEYAYYRMVRDCGIDISECRLFEENSRLHFMTRRFDRLAGGGKLHMQSLCALAHYDFNLTGAYSYEQYGPSSTSNFPYCLSAV